MSKMKWYMAIIYGIIQGITEFLPVSSSGHLAVAQNIFHVEGTENLFIFDILLHVGTLLAVFIVYRRDILPLFPAFFRVIGKIFRGKFQLSLCTRDEKLVFFLIIATLPLVISAVFSDYVEAVYSYTKVIGSILIFNGVMLFVSDRIGKGTLSVENVKIRHPVIVGFFQAIAVFPGLSRSGATITGGLLCDFDREFAVKFSFLLSIPAILGAAVVKVPHLVENPVPKSEIFPYVLGMVSAAFFGLMAMKFLIYISKRANFTFFAIYCVIIGTLAIIFG